MGEEREERLRAEIDRSVWVEFQAVTFTSDAGLLACRELDEALRLPDFLPGAALKWLKVVHHFPAVHRVSVLEFPPRPG